MKKLALLAMLSVFLALPLLAANPGLNAKPMFFQATATPHSVTLSWTSTPDACVVNTNIHRTSLPNVTIIGSTPNLAVVPVPAKTYTDTTVQAGQTYYFNASYWGGSCGGTLHESVVSNEVKVVIPPDCTLPSTIVNGVCTAPPAPPSGLTVTGQN